MESLWRSKYFGNLSYFTNKDTEESSPFDVKEYFGYAKLLMRMLMNSQQNMTQKNQAEMEENYMVVILYEGQ